MKKVPGSTPTIRDVAELAGVSIGTASKALNGKGQLKAETRLRVERAAANLGFQPNDLVRSLLRGRSYTVGLLADDMVGRFSIPLLTGIEDTLSGAEVSVFLSVSGEDAELERRHIASLLAKQVDGIIVCGSRSDPRPSIDLGRRSTPVVYAYCRPQDPQSVGFVVDNAHGARLATEHLIATGRRKIAHIAGPYSWRDQQIRLQAYMSAMHDAGVPMLANAVIGGGGWIADWGYDAAHRLLDLHPEVDAIFCGCDTIAMGTMDALKERGRRIPDDVAIAGFDNWDAIVQNTHPKLTSIDMNFHELGVRAGRALLDMIEKGSAAVPEGTIELPCTLVPRASSAVG